MLVVKEQDTEDGNFPTVKSPNPEDKEGFEIAIKWQRKMTLTLSSVQTPTVTESV